MTTFPFDLFPEEELTQWAEPEPVKGPHSAISVSELMILIEEAIDDRFRNIWIRGEVSNLRQPSSGHMYFTLKDSTSQIRVVIFRSSLSKIRFNIEDGLDLTLYGKINIYTPRGDLQFIAERAMPAGTGELQLAFEQLKKKLERSGLFNPEHKRPLPLLPSRVFVITSRTGAAVHDFIKTVKARMPSARIVICPSKVQGEDAHLEVISALRAAERIACPDEDVILITRGGGSMEDLWAFNNEALARAIYNCKVPVVSAIGHEIDFTICDFVADRRAATPTAAAQLIYPTQKELLQRLYAIQDKLNLIINNTLYKAKEELHQLWSSAKDPTNRLSDFRNSINQYIHTISSSLDKIIYFNSKKLNLLDKKLTELNPKYLLKIANNKIEAIQLRIDSQLTNIINSKIQQLERNGEQLEALNPLKVLSRGYALVYREDDSRLVKESTDAPKGTRIKVRLANGHLVCEVIKSS